MSQQKAGQQKTGQQKTGPVKNLYFSEAYG